MKRLITIAILAVAVAAAAAVALPADVVVLSAREVAPDEGAGLYYLGGCGAGYLYNGSRDALAAVAPYRVLATDGRRRDFYIVCLMGNADITADAFAAVGTAVRLSAEEIFVGVEEGVGPEKLRAVDRRVELIRLGPVTVYEGKVKAETPPTAADPVIAAAVNTITESELAGHVQTLQDCITRYYNTPGNVLAREYITDYFTAQGLAVSYYPDLETGTYHCVIGERPGVLHPDEIVIIGGHFDSATLAGHDDCPGAEDNATGTATALCAARAFKDISFERTVRYVAFDAEEAGLYGSKAYANYCASEGQNIVAVLNADMISFDEEQGNRDDLAVACKNSDYQWLLDYLGGVGALYGQNLIYDHYEWTASDHKSFWDANYAALGTIEGGLGVGGLSVYKYIHTVNDTIDKIQPAFGVRVVRDYAATFAHLAHRYDDTGIGDDGGVADAPAPKRARAFAVYPNPYRYGGGDGVRFVGLAAPAAVTVYDLAGRRVARWEVPAGVEECCWRPNAAGADLAAGIYLYRVEGKDQREAGRLAVVR